MGVSGVGVGLWSGWVGRGEEGGRGGLCVQNEGIDIFVRCLPCFWDQETEEYLSPYTLHVVDALNAYAVVEKGAIGH